MNRLEKVMANYPNLRYVFKDNMPKQYKGFCAGHVVLINNSRHETKEEIIVTVAEEIGHYVTGSGNITEQKTIVEQKQEHKARQWGNQHLVSLDDLIDCFEKGILTKHEIAEELEITEDCVTDAIESYRATKGMSFEHNGYYIKFNSDTSIQIIKLVD